MLIDFIRNSIFFNGFNVFVVQKSSSKQLKRIKSKRQFNILYVEGPGDVVESFKRWNNQDDVLSETSRTYSGQFFDFCKSKDLFAYVLSYHGIAKHTSTDQFWVENKAKVLQGRGARFHLSQILYGLRIVVTALRYRPNVVLITSGVTYWFILSPLKLVGIKVVAQLHNSLWPAGFQPVKFSKRLLLKLDGWFFRHIAFAALCISPEVERQINSISGHGYCSMYQFRGQFNRADFSSCLLTQEHGKLPFKVVFAGRIERNKGVFDIVEMAEQLRQEGIEFDICGSGSDLDELRNEIIRRNLGEIIHIHGQLNRPELLTIYTGGHAVIVPTRSDFCEGLPRACVESILLGRPVITSSLSNALDVLGDAIIEAKPNDINSFVRSIRMLKSDESMYQSLCLACEALREPFFDDSQGLTNALKQATSSIL